MRYRVPRPRPRDPGAPKPTRASWRKARIAIGSAHRECALPGAFCRDASELVQSVVFALAVSRGDHRAANTGAAGGRYFRWIRVGCNHAILAERTASATAPSAALAFCLPGDELPHLCKGPGWAARRLVLVAGCGARGCRA